MSEFLTQRIMGVSCLVVAFCLMTVMAHRTKVHADFTRLLGLGGACALMSCAWWVNTVTFSSLTLSAKIISIVLFFAISLSYSAAVMHSKSVLRWAGAFAACLLVVVGFLLDGLYLSRTTDVAIAFAIALLCINFFGHLLRARVNQALLRSTKQNQQSTLTQPITSLLRLHPELLEDKNFIDSVAQVKLTGQESEAIMKFWFGVKTNFLNFSENAEMSLQTLLNIRQLCKQILQAINAQADTSLTFTCVSDAIHVQITTTNSSALTENDLKSLYKLDADSLQVSANRDTIKVSLGYRF